jgi:hypothetical protein
MAINAGDIVLNFLGDTTQLDQAFAQLPAKAAVSTGAVSTAMSGVVGSFGLAGTAVQNLGVGMQGTLGSAVPAMQAVAEETDHARGTMALFNDVSRETLGVGLPRHVRSFIAELPGVGTALSAAFAATAVLFIIEALAKGIEKITEWVDSTEKVKVAMEKWQEAQDKVFNGFEDGSLKAEMRIDELTGQHLEALRLKLMLIDNATLSKLMEQLDKLTEEALKAKGAFDLLSRGSVLQFFGLEGSDEAKEKLKTLKEQIDQTLSTRTPESYDLALKLIDKTLDETGEKLSKLDAQQKAFQAAPHTAGIPGGSPLGAEMPDPNAIKAWQQLRTIAQGYFSDVAEAATQAAKEQGAATIDAQAKATERLRKIEEERQKGLDHRITVEARYAKDQEKQHDKAIKDAEREKDEEIAASNAVANNQLAEYRRMEQGALAFIDGEMHHVEAATQREVELQKFKYDIGIISGQQYLERIKKLYNDEAKALIDLLNQKQQLVILEAQKEAAARGKIMTVAEAKELKDFINLENQKRAVLDKSLIAIDKDVQKVTATAAKAKPTWDKFFDDLIKGSHRSGEALKTLGQLTAEAIGQSVAAAVSGSQSFGEAMQQMLKSALAMLAGKAVVKVLEELAEAASDLANPFMAWHAPFHFTAAAEWAAVAAAAGLAGAALGGGGSHGGGGGGDHPNVDANNPNNQPAQNPAQGGRNVPHLQAGGLMTADTLAMVHRNEVAIPLDNPGVMDAIGAAIARHSEGGAGGMNFYVKGLISPDSLGKVMKRMSRQAQTGRARLLATNSHKLTRRA